jgi:hypothetical protein
MLPVCSRYPAEKSSTSSDLGLANHTFAFPSSVLLQPPAQNLDLWSCLDVMQKKPGAGSTAPLPISDDREKDTLRFRSIVKSRLKMFRSDEFGTYL